MLSIAGISAIALIAAASMAGSASASSTGSTPGLVHSTVTHSSAQPAKGACYSKNIADSLTGIVSINTDDTSGWTSAGAVDFKVKKKCRITQVDATGVYAAGDEPRIRPATRDATPRGKSPAQPLASGGAPVDFAQDQA